MSPALQKLRKDLDHAKARQAQPGAAVVQPPVGFDVIELLFAALAAQDVEIQRLKAQGRVEAGGSDAATQAVATAGRVDLTSDAYVGHTESPANPAVYQAKKPKPAHVEPSQAESGDAGA
jgi:hypothetical protein